MIKKNTIEVKNNNSKITTDSDLIVRISDVSNVNKAVPQYINEFIVLTLKQGEEEIGFTISLSKNNLEFLIPRKNTGAGFPEKYTMTLNQFKKLLRSSKKALKSDGMM